ncbi:hypothetical protein [Lentzea sp. NEAU-D7]|uniref:hypothetical protein n=1 Tax=Lentzea sp. NEAU-D7 TaxID=2994667 RepID=UPI00224B0407|nr:hypothetical protein [Lentzea sp. NEAU-D7]MCX2952626.1 hypothetical protein [Lentzea sp. NEAU-D7]
MPAPGMAVIASWAALSGRGAARSLGSALDKTISPWFAALPPLVLVAEELSEGPDPNSGGLNGVFAFAVLLSVQTGRVVVRRRGLR